MFVNLQMPCSYQREKVGSNLVRRKKWLLRTGQYNTKGLSNWNYILRVLLTTGLIVKCATDSGKLPVTRAARGDEGHNED